MKISHKRGSDLRIRIVKALEITGILLSDCSRERAHTHLGSWVIDTTTTEFALGYRHSIG